MYKKKIAEEPRFVKVIPWTLFAALGIPFYSWIEITLSPEPDPKAEGAYKLIFLNDLEPDRECIRWKTRIE